MATTLAQLSDVHLRDAWPDEARDFTPWLAKNIDRLAKTLGLDLDPPEMEVAVEQYSADIVTSESGTDNRVLIENQLERSDHRHLGQILTYLAGLEAKRVIWIARDFDEAHLSAVRWLNEYTSDAFAFFAVRLRAVRIGDSPIAPVFEAVEKPNTWERKLVRRVNDAESERTRLREEFWDQYLARHPGLFKPSRSSNIWLPMLSDGSVILSMYVGSRESGMYLRAPSGKEISAFMERNEENLTKALGQSEGKQEGHYFGTWHDITLQERERWDELIDWMEGRRQNYVEVMNSAVELDEA